MITSAQFRSQNTILTTRPLVSAKSGNTTEDFIDLNKDGVANFDTRFRDVNVYYREPALSDSFDDIKSYGQRHGSEVVTGDALGGKLTALGMTRDSYDSTDAAWKPGTAGSLDAVAAKCQPLEDNVKWGIDTASHEFIVYQPKV
jgi:hypothetical protein